MTPARSNRTLVERAIASVTEDDPWLSEIYAVHGVSMLETQCGQGWKGAGVGSNNWGAIQAGKSWTGAVFVYTDTHPNADGTSTPYRVPFRAYATPLDGAIDVAKFLLRMGVIGPGGVARLDRVVRSVSERLHAKGYYEGFGKTVADRIANHERALGSCVLRVAKDLGEEPGLALKLPRPTDRQIKQPRPEPARIPLTPERIAALAVSAAIEGSDRRGARDVEFYARAGEAIWRKDLLKCDD